MTDNSYAPGRIYLNPGWYEDEPDINPWFGEDVSWSEYPLDDNPVEYIRTDIHEADLARLRSERDALRKLAGDVAEALEPMRGYIIADGDLEEGTDTAISAGLLIDALRDAAAGGSDD